MSTTSSTAGGRRSPPRARALQAASLLSGIRWSAASSRSPRAAPSAAASMPSMSFRNTVAGIADPGVDQPHHDRLPVRPAVKLHACADHSSQPGPRGPGSRIRGLPAEERGQRGKPLRGRRAREVAGSRTRRAALLPEWRAARTRFTGGPGRRASGAPYLILAFQVQEAGHGPRESAPGNST